MTSANNASPNQLPTPNNQTNNSEATENGNTRDHRTLWKLLGFTDEIDRRDFGDYWEVVEKLKYNNPALKSLSSIIACEFEEEDTFCKEAWIRLGWYLEKNDFIEEVDFEDLGFITDDVLRSMFGSVIWTPKERIRSLDFRRCSITFDGIKILLPFIKAAPSISEFCIDGNNIGTVEFGLVATALCGRQIEHLSFENCGINDIIPSLTHCKFPELREVHFSGNQMGDKGAEFIAYKFLQSCPKLEALRLGDCEISDRGVNSIADALASNATLLGLFLDVNSISDEGVASFAKALRSNYTLIYLNMNGSTVGWSDTSTQYRDLQFALYVNALYERDLDEARRVKARYFANDSDGLECAVCLQKKSEFFFFLPCMHKICTDCNDSYDKDICHMCKQKIEKRQRLY